MTENHKIQHKTPVKWKDVVENVENANLNNVEKIKWNSKIRQKAYCH